MTVTKYILVELDPIEELDQIMNAFEGLNEGLIDALAIDRIAGSK